MSYMSLMVVWRNKPKKVHGSERWTCEVFLVIALKYIGYHFGRRLLIARSPTAAVVLKICRRAQILPYPYFQRWSPRDIRSPSCINILSGSRNSLRSICTTLSIGRLGFDLNRNWRSRRILLCFYWYLSLFSSTTNFLLSCWPWYSLHLYTILPSSGKVTPVYYFRKGG